MFPVLVVEASDATKDSYEDVANDCRRGAMNGDIFT